MINIWGRPITWQLIKYQLHPNPPAQQDMMRWTSCSSPKSRTNFTTSATTYLDQEDTQRKQLHTAQAIIIESEINREQRRWRKYLQQKDRKGRYKNSSYKNANLFTSPLRERGEWVLDKGRGWRSVSTTQKRSSLSLSVPRGFKGITTKNYLLRTRSRHCLVVAALLCFPTHTHLHPTPTPSTQH